ncbi:hypothetical protein QL285_076239 [Trifolium repens]|nr:hypothetical protein QL285_076237 [Trifolium repens]KAK2375344.1 hypothetical protein QL285_076239 [Trifolium repens]
MYLPRSHIENTSQKHAKHTTNCNTAKSKACLTKPFEKTEIKWSPYLGKHSQQATFTQHYVLPLESDSLQFSSKFPSLKWSEMVKNGKFVKLRK